MKRWEMDAFGRASLRLREVAVPEPGPGEVLVKVAAVSLNYRDKMMIENGMGGTVGFPFTPASDLAGTIAAVGAGATRFRTGDRVISTFTPGWIDGRPAGNARVLPGRALGGALSGVLAEYVAFPESWFAAAPKSLDSAGASTLPCAGLTAWFALVERGGLRAGESVLVQGTGGVALFGLQIAKAHGAEVFVTSGSGEKRERARALGADHAIDRTEWVAAVHRLTGDRGIDHILEIVGGAHLARSLEAVAVHGRISVIGVLEGFEVSGPVLNLLVKSPVVQGISVGHRRALEDLVRAVDATGLSPVIDRRYAMDALPEALDHLDCGPFGKIVVEVG
ncbi:NAD(P)-dependent alcohol dehydrogenase [Azospirillum sp. TSO22-1]|uniref:zinc-dependent alcohol dehydrogenase family protein n=1 Tax=Azospirillum sp. TSO22-1 TaxID=716789 RepID=UPI000D611D93|nr:NAD(P)-dependent alcohol dehydrogenase [Azospirillum sp. TSO22-1]PWC34844.1 alcohol dehydrogenase [Azospirillum sp. TSO22-1]